MGKIVRRTLTAVAVAVAAALGGGDFADALSAFEGLDTEDPVVESAWLTPHQVRVPKKGAVEVHARARITDGSGVHSVQVESWGLRPAAAREAGSPVLWADLESGTTKDGVWHAVIRVDRSTPPGTYEAGGWPTDIGENDNAMAEYGTFTVLPPR